MLCDTCPFHKVDLCFLPCLQVVRMGMVYSYSGPSIYEHVYAFAHGGYMDADGGGEPLKAPRPPLPLFQSDTKEEL